MPQTGCFSTSAFSGFGLDFAASWASNLEPSWLQIRRAACSARRVKSYRIFSFGNPGRTYLGEGPVSPQAGPNLSMLGPCWRFFRSWARLGRIFRVLLRVLAFLIAFLAFWNALGTILEPPGLHFHGSWDLQDHIFLGFFAGFACLRKCAKTSQKLCPPPRQREFHDFSTRTQT